MAHLDNKYKLYIIIFVLFLGVIIFFLLKLNNKNKFIKSQDSYIIKLEKEINYYKTLDTTFVVKRDSIEYNIIQRDSIIYKIKEEYEKQKDNVLVSSDGTVVSKFNELVWAD